METVKSALIEFLNKPNDKVHESIVLRPHNHLDKISEGKNYSKRANIIMESFNFWLKVPEEKFLKVKEVINIIFNSVVLFDDVQDNSTLRRGSPTAHVIYGVPSTINSCLHSFFRAFALLFDMENDEACKIIVEELSEGWLGQGTEIYWRENFICPTESEFMLMVIRKASCVFKFVSRLMNLFSENQADLYRLSSLLGLYVQILDDYQNFNSEKSFKSKGFCEDLEEGKFTLPVIHAVQNNHNEKEILKILKDKPKKLEVKQRFVKLLEESGSFEYTRQVLDYLHAEIEFEATKLGPNPVFEDFLKSFVY